jgi:rfaE bifunctional protein nucleotidyltransferase chain/domain
MNSNKFFEIKTLKKKILEEKKNHKTIAFANGGFDLIHIGHIRYLKAAKKKADILIVALNSDKSLKNLKGKNRAIINEKGRIKIVSSFECVDYVTLFNDKTVDKILLMLKPDFHCKGSDYTKDTVPEKETVKSYKGKIAIVGGEKIHSTSEILKKIVNNS